MNRMRTILKRGACVSLSSPPPERFLAAEKGGVSVSPSSTNLPPLDQHVVTSELTTMIAQHIFEGLYTL